MLHRFLLLFGFSFLFLGLFGQNDSFNSLNMFSHMFYNPGYAGDGNEIETKILAREQWMGFQGAPKTQIFNVDAPFKLFNMRHGAGLSIINDQIGNNSNVGLNISYAYRQNMAQGDLGIGIGLNMISQTFSGTWTPTDQGDYSIPLTSDKPPLIFDANLGVFYRADNLFLSISARNILDSEIKYKTSEGGEASATASFIGREVYFSTGYEYQLPNPMFSVRPGVFIASDFSATQLAVSGILTYNKRFFGGVEYKPVDAITFIAGLTLPSGIEVALSYDVTTSRMIRASSGSFEFMLGYSFNLDLDKDARKYKSVRFL